MGRYHFTKVKSTHVSNFFSSERQASQLRSSVAGASKAGVSKLQEDGDHDRGHRQECRAAELNHTGKARL
jgi:hypothetical protein